MLVVRRSRRPGPRFPPRVAPAVSRQRLWEPLEPWTAPLLDKPDDIDRDLHRRNRSSVLKPVGGVPILGPAHSRPIVRSDSISVVSDRSLQYVDDAWSVFMVVNRAEDGSRLEGEYTQSRFTPWEQSYRSFDEGARKRLDLAPAG